MKFYWLFIISFTMEIFLYNQICFPLLLQFYIPRVVCIVFPYSWFLRVSQLNNLLLLFLYPRIQYIIRKPRNLSSNGDLCLFSGNFAASKSNSCCFSGRSALQVSSFLSYLVFHSQDIFQFTSTFSFMLPSAWYVSVYAGNYVPMLSET